MHKKQNVSSEKGVSDASSEGCEAFFGEVLFDSSGEGASLLPFSSEEVVRFSAYAFVGFTASKLNAMAGVLVKTRQKVKTPTSTSRAFSFIKQSPYKCLLEFYCSQQPF